jgi:DNA polymerase
VSDDGRAVIGAWHGKPVNLEVHKLKFTIFPLYHPASIIYNRELGGTYDRDLENLNAYLTRLGI